MAYVGLLFAAMPPWDVPSDSSDDDDPPTDNSDSSLTSSDDEAYDDYSVQKKLKVQLAKVRNKMLKSHRLMQVANATGNRQETDRQLARYRRLETLFTGYHKRLDKLNNHLHSLPSKINITPRAKIKISIYTIHLALKTNYHLHITI